MTNNLNNLQQWLLYTHFGRYTLVHERIFYHNIVQQIYGYYSLQIGLPQINFLQGNKIPNHYIINHDVQCELFFLPFKNNCIDLIVCPHVLEFTPNYYHLLEECYRILIPNGKLIITGFNQQSLLNLFLKKITLIKKAQPINLLTLKKQLATLNFNIEGGKFFCYHPPINNTKFLSQTSWIDKVGDRWLPTLANNYALIVSKNIVTPSPIISKQSLIRTSFKPKFETSKACKTN